MSKSNTTAKSKEEQYALTIKHLSFELERDNATGDYGISTSNLALAALYKELAKTAPLKCLRDAYHQAYAFYLECQIHSLTREYEEAMDGGNQSEGDATQ